ncbi:hypothetical protein Lalb_Chr12g0199071 [Lupinus albus]|uniref:Uncharacterized protein n=1 Tax=Lupinus albus TaxID=3870 RepID=A0A6A4PLJ2_LUPAL|nr:hypothetical protein Lalb_Chr12g0199071 [Lupinus albus]
MHLHLPIYIISQHSYNITLSLPYSFISNLSLFSQHAFGSTCSRISLKWHQASSPLSCESTATRFLHFLYSKWRKKQELEF